MAACLVPLVSLVALTPGCTERPMRGDSGIRPFAFDLWDIRCPSGLRVIVERAPGSRVAGVTTVVGVGGQDDPAGREGLAHLVEHLTFRAHGPTGGTMAHRMGQLGGTGNARTGFEDTAYYTFVANQDLRALLALEGERAADPLAGIDEQTFAVEREVVRSELRERTETGVNGRALSLVQEALFPATHSYSRPLGGTHETLSAITLDDARRFVAARYRPEAMTMLIVGDVDLPATEQLVKATLPPALYGDPAHARPVPARRPSAPPALPSRAAVPLRPSPTAVETPELWISWSLPGGYGPERFMAEMWAALVQGRFARGELDDADIARVSFFTVPGQQATLLIGRVELVQGTHPEESAKLVLQELPWVGGDEFFLGAVFRGLKLGAMRHLSLNGEDVEERSEARAVYAHFTGNAGYYGAVIDTLKSITGDQARAFAKQYLPPERARTVLLVPRPADTRPEQTAAATPGGGASGGGNGATSGWLVVPVGPSRRPDAGQPQPEARRLGEVKTVTLPNGLPLIAVRRRGAPVVTATIGFHGGTGFGKIDTAYAAEAATKLATAESPSDYGIGLWFDVERDMVIETGQTGAANLLRLLEMLSFSLRGYDVDWPSDKVQSKTIPLWKKRQASPSWQADRAFWSALYGAHPYGAVPTADTFSAVPRQEVEDWLRQTLAPRNAALVVIGDVDPGEIEQAARQSIGQWHEAGDALPAPAPATARPAGLTPAALALPGLAAPLITHRPGSTQVTIDLGCLLPPASEAAFPGTQVAAEVIRSRLQRRLRERLGATYGVHGSSRALRGGTTELQLSTIVDNAQLAEALDSIGWTLTGGPTNRDDATDLEAARGAIEAVTLVSDTSLTLAHDILQRWNLGWSVSSVDDYPQRVAATTPDEVDATINACARGAVLSLLGDRQVVQQALHH